MRMHPATVTPELIESIRFSRSWRGFNPNEVLAFVHRVSVYYRASCDERARITDRYEALLAQEREARIDLEGRLRESVQTAEEALEAVEAAYVESTETILGQLAEAYARSNSEAERARAAELELGRIRSTMATADNSAVRSPAADAGAVAHPPVDPEAASGT